MNEAALLSTHEGQVLVSTQTVQHDYVTQNGKVVRETVRTNGTVTAVMDFIYDESGSPVATAALPSRAMPARQSPCCCHSLVSLAPATGGGRLAPRLP